MKTRLERFIRRLPILMAIFCVIALAPLVAMSAPYAAMVIDARTGEVLHSRNADTRLHPASLTKMMTLYVTFDAVARGEISMDTVIKISKKAASEQPSKLGLRSGQKIKLRYLVRAAAVKSANDAATAIGEAISGSEAAFARRMNRTAKALGMTRTTFKNAHGLTESGHQSTARDMTLMGRRLFYDFPQYYNLFSRRTTDAGMATVSHTNRRFLNSYKGADGIKTGYTRAAGFNLVASAERGDKRIITTVFGGRSTASRNAKVAELMDMGFRRAPTNATVRRPATPLIAAAEPTKPATGLQNAAATLRVVTAVTRSLRPLPRPVKTPSTDLLLAMRDEIKSAVQEAQTAESYEESRLNAGAIVGDFSAPVAASTDDASVAERAAGPSENPSLTQSPEELVLASITPEAPQPELDMRVVTRISSNGGRKWGINVGRYGSRYQAERELLKTALKEMATLDGSLRKVVQKSSGFDANFLGMSQETAELACRRLLARNAECRVLNPA